MSAQTITQPIIELENVSRIFGTDRTRTTALDGVSLRIMPGEFVAIVGPSGSGKSTLLNILGLLDRMSSGRYLLSGVDAQTLSERQRDQKRNELLGFVFQDSRMLLTDTAAGNASLGLKVRGASWSERTHRVGSVLRRLGLAHRMAEKAINLSGGERQRVAIARAMSTGPAVILADEPTGALDSKNSEKIMAHFRELNAQGVTVVIITHDQAVARAADRRIELVDGEVAQDSGGPVSSVPEDVKTSALHAAPASADIPRGRLGTRLWDEFCDAISAHTAKPGRAVLLLAAFMLGTGGLICSIGISESAAAQVTERLTQASLDEVVVRSVAKNAYADGFYRPGNETSQRIDALEGVKGSGFVASIAPVEARITLLPLDAVPNQPVFDGTVLVADTGYLDIHGVKAEPRQAADLLSAPWHGAVAILGQGAAEKLGVVAPSAGAQIWVNGVAVPVVGMITDTGRKSTLKESIIVSEAVGEAFSPQDPSLVVRTVPGYPAALAEAIPYAVAPASPADIRIETVADLRNLRFGVATDLGALVGLVSVLLLLLASLSSAIAMYLSVQARSSEIALRRALGSSRASIWRVFTMEGLVIGAAGGVAGAAAGICAVVIACAVQGWTPTLSPIVLLLGLAVGCVSGVGSATYPAIVAARADPAIAIRG